MSDYSRLQVIHTRKRYQNYLFIFIFFLVLSHSYGQTFIASKLKCDYKENPIGIDNRNPQFSWLMNDSRRGASQTAYQIIVSTNSQKLQTGQGDMWDTGKVNSDQSLHVVYKGLALQTGKKYYWRVKIWDLSGKPSNWSEPTTFEMGLLSPTDFKAEWIGRRESVSLPKIPDANWIWHPQPVPAWHMVYFKKSIQIPSDKTVAKVLIKSSVDNCYEVYFNQAKIAYIREWQPNRGKRFFLYDVTRFVRIGENVVTVAAVQTNVNEQGGFIATISIEYTDGSTMIIPSDDSWSANSTDRSGWIPELPMSRWTKARIVESYGGRNWGTIGQPYQPSRSQMLRREFSLKKKVINARAYVSGLGGYYVYINGKAVGKDIFAPGWTHYPKHIQYQTYDVTSMLAVGNNAVGAVLGNLWWSGDIGWRGMGQYSEGPLRMIMQLAIQYEDGTSELVITDKNWRIHTSPITFNSIYDGESYDARLEIPNWSFPGLAEKDWLPVEVLQESKKILVSEQLQPIQETNELKAESVTEIATGKFVFDFGQNIVGWARIKVQGPAGTKLTLRFAETLNPDGSLKTEPLRSAKATDEYILNGKGEEIWEPKFTYHGFQYVEITGYQGRPSKDVVTGIVIHNNIVQRGQFASSNNIVNKIQSNLNWSIRGNLFSVITNCPQRDERLGWAGDAQIIATTASYNRDMTLMYYKYMRDITDCQREDGDILNVNPNAFDEGLAQAGWGDAVVIIPWRVYQFTGDKRILEENYPNMVKWHKKKQSESKGFLREASGLGDWVSVVPTPIEPIGSAYYYYSTKLLSDIAKILGKTEDGKQFGILAEKISQAYNEKHFDRETDNYVSGSQTANLLPLAFGITSSAVAENVAKNIADDVKKRNVHLSTGFLGTQYLLPILSQYGYHDLSYQLATQWTYPSWGYMVENNATTIWELWNSDKQGADMNSRNNYALGTAGEWFYEYLGGIRIDNEHPGFKKTIIAPKPVGNLTWAVSGIETMYGFIFCRWEKKENSLIVNIVIPANSSASVTIPAKSIESVKENNSVLGKVQGVSNPKMVNGNVNFDLGSGKYVFTIAL